MEVKPWYIHMSILHNDYCNCWNHITFNTRTGLPVCAQAVVCLYTCHGLPVHMPWSACTQSMVCLYTSHSLPVHRPWSACTQVMVCLYTRNGLSVHKPWSACTQAMLCLYTSQTLPVLSHGLPVHEDITENNCLLLLTVLVINMMLLKIGETSLLRYLIAIIYFV